MDPSDENGMGETPVEEVPVDGAEGEEEDEFYENPVEMIKEFGTHPLMEKAQKALMEQLNSNEYKLRTAVSDKENELKRVTTDREQMGVQLYSLQQQLARLQISLENSHAEYNSLVDTKLQEQDMVRSFEENNKEQSVLLNEHEKQHKKYVTELESLHETLRQIEKYNEEVKGEIALTRRSTYKTEQNMVDVERHKDEQDSLVENLTKKTKTLSDAIAIHVDQINNQKEQNEEMRGVIEETVGELDLIQREKKQLLIQWKAALSGLSRRDEAVSSAGAALKVAEDAVGDFDVQIESAKRSQYAEQGKHEGLVNMRDRMDAELSWVEENLTKMRQEQTQLQERYQLLAKSLTQTDAEAKKLDLITKQLTNDAEALLQNLQVVTLERQKLEEELTLLKSGRHNVDKAVQNLIVEKSKVQKKIHEEENKATDVQNEIARTRLDGMNAKALNAQLEETFKAVQSEMQGKEQLIEKYQIEIRQRTDEIEKKMYRVDRLNKKYEKMIESAGGEEENLGPMENTIRNLNKQIEKMNEECRVLEHDWLKKQTELVSVASEGEKISESNAELQARITILTQQQLRLTKDLKTVQNEVKAGQLSNIDLRKDVSKLNVLIGENHEQEGELQNTNYVLELGAVEDLKDMEEQSVQLQAKVASTRNDKAELLDEIVEQERQAMLWEKKIQLDKETKAALDPSVGADETSNMVKEIHRMELRFEALKREQERLSSEMERAILKRSVIQNRYSKPDGEKKGGKNIKELSQASAKKKIVALKREARVLAEQTSQYTTAVDDRKSQLSEMSVELESLKNSYSDMEQENQSLQTRINDLLYTKQLNQERIAYKQKYAKRLKDLSAEGVDSAQNIQIERRLLSATQALDNVKDIITDIRDSHPHLTEVLARVEGMTDPSIELNDSVSAHVDSAE